MILASLTPPDESTLDRIAAAKALTVATVEILDLRQVGDRLPWERTWEAEGDDGDQRASRYLGSLIGAVMKVGD